MMSSARASVDYFRKNLRTIQEQPALRIYGAILSGVLAVNAWAWFTYNHVVETATAKDGVCWPTLPGCLALRSSLTPGLVRTATLAHIALGLAAAILFLTRRVGSAVAVFTAALVIGIAVYALDYRMRSNETYMVSWCVAVFLLAPRKAATLQGIIALFYFWAGTLKVNAEWVSGAALYKPPFLVPDALIPASCVYVLFLEMAIIWGLFSRSPRVRWAVYAQLLLFHAVSWNVVGFHYPLIMLGLTSIYPLVWRLAPEDTLTWAKIRSDSTTRSTVGATALLFSCFQMVPRLESSDSAITGEGRYFALHMFDARVECSGGATVRGRRGQSAFIDLVDPKLATRTRCDPIVLLAAAKRVCARAAAYPEPVTVDLVVDAKRSTDAEMRPLMHIDDFCGKSIEYSPWHHNDWITSD